MDSGSFFAELKRRNVYKVAVAYAVVAWLLIQAASILFPTYEAPAWVMKVFVAVVALGFPVALIIAWAFEMTPEGMKRTEDVPHEQMPRWSRRKFVALIAVVAATAAALFVWQLLRGPVAPSHLNDAAVAAADKSIAVLPFVNMTSDKEQDYFSDGLSEELLNQLAQVPQLRVIARTSSFSFKGKEVDTGTIAHALNVANILEGSVRKSAKTLRVTAQLIRASDSSHLWSKTYDRDLTDIFKVQDEIAADVVAALKVKLLPAQELPKAPRTNNPEAYQQYLQGRYYLYRFSIAELDKARSYLERACQLDPQFPLAWAALSRVANLEAGLADKLTRAQFDADLARAKEASDRAIELAPDLPEALSARFDVQFIANFDWKGGAETIKRAKALAPSDPMIIKSAAMVAVVFGDSAGGVDLARQAVALDPVNAEVRAYLGAALLQARRPAEARAEFDRVRELNPSTPWAYAGSGFAWLMEGKNAEALAAAEHETIEFSRLAVTAIALWNLERKEESDAALATLIKDDADVGAFQIAEVYSARGDKDQAFAWLERARRQQDGGLAYYPNDPLLDPLHSDPRWIPFRRSLGLADDQLK
jgi:serine/threonine-protein kinase